MIEFDKHNYRKHGDKNKAMIAKSLKECGAGRSVLLDADDTLIAGNGVYEQAKKQGIPVRVIETDGTELIAVKRTDIGQEDEKRKRLALADNATSDSSEWNVEELQADWGADELAEFGIRIKEKEGEQERPECEFAEILGEENNFIVLKFTSDVDWLQAQTFFELETKMCGSTVKSGVVTKGMRRIGVARVLDGAKLMDKFTKV